MTRCLHGHGLNYFYDDNAAPTLVAGVRGICLYYLNNYVIHVNDLHAHMIFCFHDMEFKRLEETQTTIGTSLT